MDQESIYNLQDTGPRGLEFPTPDAGIVCAMPLVLDADLY